MSRPNEDPSWVDDDDPLKAVEPSSTKKLAGFIYKERGAAQYFNWLFRNLVKWVLHIDVSVNQFDPHEASTPDMTVLLTAGKIQNGATVTSVAAQTSPTITAPITDPRIDRIVIDNNTGAISIIAGAEAASPVAPDLTFGKIAIAQVLLQTSSTEITGSMITDERVSVVVDIGLIGEEVLTSSSTTITLSGIDIDYGDSLTVDIFCINSAAALSTVSLYFNTNYTPSAYTSLRSFLSSLASRSEVADATGKIGAIHNNSRMMSTLQVMAKSSTDTVASGKTTSVSSLGADFLDFLVSRNTGAKLTQLRVSATELMAAGSYIRVRRNK